MIYSIIVTYNPNEYNLTLLVNALISSGVTPIIVDNASKEDFSAPCQLIKLDSNYGIAKAQNIGIEYALKQNAKAIIFFDQDSSIKDEFFIKKLYQPILDKKASITAPVFTDLARDFIYSIVDIDKHGKRTKYYPAIDDAPFKVSNVISSGTMVDIQALTEIGDMVDELFIDYVDTEWCLRAYNKGFDILVMPNARMTHSIGDKTIKLGHFYVPKHSPFRRYYRIRNAFFLLRQEHIPKLMAIREILFSIIHQGILIVFSRGERLAYIQSLYRGLRDGVLGRFK
ncbi:glycosyltransferase family 2 protein [Aeromonas caviae]|uniref:glycosyltransferase family 2 protein n=1 Tax=Aeromonas caviae TaxID=648 RepID=UPI001FB919C4|nr:glycosyltransferase family 2 protein [Aeromonas caviae]BDN88964.1 dTDP-rhamnosyl transferase RfbF [Aeromonas caviae]GKR38018.1 dTDP-rhamnosyl transferase RfbF [Aeromonas caviae]